MQTKYIIDRIKNLLQKIAWKFLSPKWKLPSQLIVEINNVAEWVIYNDIFVDGEYNFAINWAIKNGNQQSRFEVLDLGANVGYFGLKLVNELLINQKDSDFKMNLIEGSPAVFKTLSQRLNQSLLNNKVNAINALVGQKSGSANIIESDFHVMNTVISKKHRNAATVNFYDLGELYKNINTIDILKCDIEGSELSFLENYPELLKKVKCMVIELHPNLCNVEKCKDLIKAAGFNNHKQFRRATDFSVEFYWRENL